MASFIVVFISSLGFPRLKLAGIKALLLLVRSAGHWLHTFHIWVTNILVSPNFLQLREFNLNVEAFCCQVSLGSSLSPVLPTPWCSQEVWDWHENNIQLYLPTTTSCVHLDPTVIQHSNKTEHIAEAEHKQVKANTMVRVKSLCWICNYIFVCFIRFKPTVQDWFFINMFRYVLQTDQSLLCSEPGWLSMGQCWRKYTLLSIWVYWVNNKLEPVWLHGFC